MGYCTALEVLARMGQHSATDPGLVARIDDLIAACSDDIDGDTGREFTAVSGSRTFGVDEVIDGHELRTPDFEALTALRFDDDDDGTFETTIAADGYELDTVVGRRGWPHDTVRLLDRCFPYVGRRRVRIEIEADWGWPQIPDGINQACSLLVVRLLQRPQAPFGVVSFGELGSANIRNTDPDYLKLIGQYKRPMIA